MDRDFFIRLRSSVIVLGSAILFFWFGGIPLFAVLAVVSLIGMFELYQAASVWKTPLAAAGMMAGALFLEAVYLGWDAWLLFVLFLGFILILGTFVFTFPRYQFSQTAAGVFGVLYVPVMLSYLYRIRSMPDGFALIWLVFIASWGSDTLAYCAGRLFGRHKMTPQLSPKKTWEGAAGGVLGAALLGFLYALAFGGHLKFLGDPLLATPLLCAAGSVVSQIGDLAASAIKRSVGVKDYGNLIPGHGGILDRFDSVIVTAPLVYYLLLLFMK
ncbi:MAG: phosphatidate cytidylyltransferase [Lachnospiraceae bacterium]|nr:phosphatidate cytidylyltransferase [Lachnospiraceae bacterium]